jgi:autotransporter-associated beta strand protein
MKIVDLLNSTQTQTALPPQSRHPFQFRPAAALAVLAALLALFATPPVRAGSLTWDITSGDGATITAGSGTWDLVTANWNDGAGNVLWTQTSTTAGDNTATFAGTDGTVDQYVVTLGSQMAAQSITFTSSGYQIVGSPLALMNGANNGPITVAAGKTNTINSTLRYNHNKATTVAVDGVLNLGGGTTASFNPQWNFSGAGTVNLTAGTYKSNIGTVNNAVLNLTGGTYSYTPGANSTGATFGSAAGQNVNVTVSGTGTLNLTPLGAYTANFVALGKSMGGFKSTLTVKSGGTVNMGITSTYSGELQIAANADSSGQLDVQGGNLTVGNGTTANKIYLFKAGANALQTASMTQSGGIVNANGIQFGSNAGTYDPTSSATLQLSGGSLYVGAQGITLGSGAAALPVTIQLQGGTLGASVTWSSSLGMKLGTTGGGVTIQAADESAVARNITLSGILSNDGAVNGTLTKTGAGSLTLSGTNTYTGATVVSAGTLVLGNPSAVSSSSALTIADGAALSLTTTTSTVPNLTFANTGTLNFNIGGGGTNLTVSAANGVTNSGAAGSVTINLTGNVPANGTYTLIAYSGSLQGSGFSAYKLGATPAGKTCQLLNTAGAVQVVVTDPFYWTGAQSSQWSTNTIAGSKNWTLGAGGSPADFVNGSAVVLDDTATTYTVDVSVADVTVTSITFSNNGGTPYTLQGTKAITGPASLTKLGSQTLKIFNTNTYTGATTISAGTLQLGASNVLPDGPGTGNVTVDGTLDLNTFSETINGLSGAASGIVDTVAGGTVTLTVGNGDGSGTFNGTVQNTAGTLGIVKTGSGELFLKGNNSFTGGVLVKNGTLNGGGTASALGTGGVTLGGSGSAGAAFIGGQDFSATVNVTVNPPDSGINVIGANGAGSGMNIGAIILNNANVMVQTVSAGNTAATTVKGGVTGTGNLLLNNLSTTTGKVTLSGASPINHTGTITSQGVGATANVISAVIGANVTGLIQDSAICPLTLSAANLYTGPTTISAGTLKLSGSGSIANSTNLIVGTVPGTVAILDATAVGGITIGAGQTLMGHGTVTGSVTNDGTLAPGTSIGKLTFGGNLTLNAGSTNVFEVNGSTLTNDVVALGGAVTYGGVLKVVPSGTFTNGQTFTLFSGAGATDPSNFANISASGATTFSFTNGVLTVLSTGSVTPVKLTNSVSGNTLSLSWPAGQGWRLQIQTNSLAVGLNTNWEEAAGSSVSVTNITINKTQPTVFYRLVWP